MGTMAALAMTLRREIPELRESSGMGNIIYPENRWVRETIGMADERWERVEELFFAAGALAGDERAALLDRECGTDLDLRAEVDSLLEKDTETAAGISSAIESVTTSLFALDSLQGVRLGAYEVVPRAGSRGRAVANAANAHPA